MADNIEGTEVIRFDNDHDKFYSPADAYWNGLIESRAGRVCYRMPGGERVFPIGGSDIEGQGIDWQTFFDPGDPTKEEHRAILVAARSLNMLSPKEGSYFAGAQALLAIFPDGRIRVIRITDPSGAEHYGKEILSIPTPGCYEEATKRGHRFSFVKGDWKRGNKVPQAPILPIQPKGNTDAHFQDLPSFDTEVTSVLGGKILEYVRFVIDGPVALILSSRRLPRDQRFYDAVYGRILSPAK